MYAYVFSALPCTIVTVVVVVVDGMGREEGCSGEWREKKNPGVCGRVFERSKIHKVSINLLL